MYFAITLARLRPLQSVIVGISNNKEQCQGKRNCAWIRKQCNSHEKWAVGCEFNSI